MLLIPSRLFSPLLIIYSILVLSPLSSAQLCPNFTIFCYDFMVQRLVLPEVSSFFPFVWPCILCIFHVLSYSKAQSHSPGESFPSSPGDLPLEACCPPALGRAGGFLASVQLTSLPSQPFLYQPNPYTAQTPQMASEEVHEGNFLSVCMAEKCFYSILQT